MNQQPPESAAELAVQFPDSFRFGIADADLQVIGEDACVQEEGSQPTMWGQFAKEAGKTHDGGTPALSVDRYHRFEEDGRLIDRLGFRHYRTSVSWARILRKDGSRNDKAIAWYRTYFEQLRSWGIKIYVTLYHWELPHNLHLDGGWKNRRTADLFVKHAEAVVEELDDLIEEYFILNEPWCSAHNSYYTGIHAPGETSLRDTLVAAHHLLLAQAQAFRAMKQLRPEARIGTVVNIEPAFPDTDSVEDHHAALLAHQFFNAWFLDPIFKGHYPKEIQEVYADQMPEFSNEDLEAIRIGPELHSLGINYYQGKMVRSVPSSPLRYEGVRREGEQTNGLGWSVFVPPVYPQACYEALRKIHHHYQDHGLPPLYITENGYAGQSGQNTGDTVEDPLRVAYFQKHLTQILRAQQAGIPITAYFAWTLMDNFEWAEGYRPESRFGIVHVDFKTLQRTPKASARFFQDLLNHRKSSVTP